MLALLNRFKGLEYLFIALIASLLFLFMRTASPQQRNECCQQFALVFASKEALFSIEASKQPTAASKANICEIKA